MLRSQFNPDAERTSRVHARAITFVAILIGNGACSFEPKYVSDSPSATSGIERHDDRFVRLDESGTVELEKLGRVRLAGIKMRDPGQTKQPDATTAMSSILSSVSRDVRVEHDPTTSTVVVYYRQPIFIRDKYNPLWVLMPQSAWGCLNEALVYLGAATIDPKTGQTKPQIETALARAQRIYATDAYQGRSRTDLAKAKRDPSSFFFYCREEDGLHTEYRAVVATGDSEARGSKDWWYRYFDGSSATASAGPPRP